MPKIYRKDAARFAYASPSAHLGLLGLAFLVLGLMVWRVELLAVGWPLAGYLRPACRALLAVGALALTAAGVLYAALPDHVRIRHMVRRALYCPAYGNPLHLQDGELLPKITCRPAENGNGYVLTAKVQSCTVENIKALASFISSALSGRYKDYAVISCAADPAYNMVVFIVDDVTVDRRIVINNVEELRPASPTRLTVQNGTAIDLTTSGSILVAGKTRSGKTTGIIALLLQALMAGPDKYGSTVKIIDPKRAELSRLPGVVTLDEDGEARAILAALREFADSITQRQAVLNEKSDNANNGYAYLVHRTKSSRNRYQYDPVDVTANFDYVGLVEQQIPQEIARAHKEKTGTIKDKLDLLYAGGLTKRELESQLSGSELARYSRQIDVVWSKRLQRQAAEWREKMKAEGGQVETIWLYGPAGTGKSRLAKSYAEKRGQPYYVAGSSRDTFQNYEGQHTLILDELRPKTMNYEDLLRLMDPFGMTEEVMAPSRYADKAIACDLIIITTPYSPAEFHAKIFGKGASTTQDALSQLHRRISLLLRIEQSSIYMVQIDDDKYSNVGAAKVNPYFRLNAPATTNRSLDLFNSMFQ